MLSNLRSRDDDRVARRGPRRACRWPATVTTHAFHHVRIASKQNEPFGPGGDFYVAVPHRDGRVSIVIADVCGNGPSAAALVPQLRAVLHRRLTREQAPAMVLAALNEWMVRTNRHDRFVTAVCVRVDPWSGRTEIASAGHLGPFVKRARGDAQEPPLSIGLALGILPAQVYPTTYVDLQPDDALVLVTDGITDWLASAGDLLGRVGLLSRLERLRHDGPESICSALLQPEPAIAQDATVIALQLCRRHRRAPPSRRPPRRGRTAAIPGKTPPRLVFGGGDPRVIGRPFDRRAACGSFDSRSDARTHSSSSRSSS
jgi:Stage II sporulation protein E (SpoIIE)